MALVVSLSPLVPSHPAAADAPLPAPGTLWHTGTGRSINMLNLGDSYAAGNGASTPSFESVSPDDPSMPLGEYAGDKCYRSYENAAAQAYGLLGSRGFYINRACSGKLVPDVINKSPSEVSGFAGTEMAKRTDLITMTAGGNDLNFVKIVQFCILAPATDVLRIPVTDTLSRWQRNSFELPDGRTISRNCHDFLTKMSDGLKSVVSNERDTITKLLDPNNFGNARVVLNGYPLLLDRKSQQHASGSFTTDTQNYAYDELKVIMGGARDAQKKMIEELSAANNHRVAFNDVYEAFGGYWDNHGVFSKSPWIHSIRFPFGSTEPYMNTLHPNPEGQYQIAANLVRTVNATKWFADRKSQTRTGKTLYFSPAFSQTGPTKVLTDGSRDFYREAWLQAIPQLNQCTPSKVSAFNVTGWLGANHMVTPRTSGPDTIKVICQDPRTGDVVLSRNVSQNREESFVAEQSAKGQTTLHAISTAWLFNCLDKSSTVRHYQAGGYVIAGPPVSGWQAADCVPAGWRNEVLTDPTNASWWVDQWGWRHHILSVPTFNFLTHNHGAAIKIPVQVDLDTIPKGADQPEQLDATDLEGKIIRRDDGISYVVVGGHTRHIPDFATDVCAQFVDHRSVAYTNLSGTLIRSLAEDSVKFSCNLNHKILHQTNTPDPRPAYTYHDNKRFWISDGWTYKALVRSGWPVVDVPGWAIAPLTMGGSETSLLDPADVPRNTIIRRNDNVSWVVDGSGYRHHIPYSQDDVCWRDLRGFHVSATNLTGAQANSMVEKDAWPCIIGPRIVKADDNRSYTVDSTNTKRWIPDVETFWELVRRRGLPISGPWPAADVNAIPGTAAEPQLLNPDTVRNTLMCRNGDGVCWAVDGNNVRHHVPDYGSFLCWQRINNWHVSRWVSYEQGVSLQEAAAWPCTIGHRIVKSDDSRSYLVDSNNTRHEIPDAETFWQLARWFAIVGPWPAGEVNGLRLGGREVYRIDPNSVRNTLLCRDDDVCWAVDNDGVRHHVPGFSDNVCWRWVNGWHVSRRVNYEQAASLPEGGAWGCSLDRYILATTAENGKPGASYWMEGATRRWIQDAASFYYYRDRSKGVIRGISIYEAKGLREGDWMPRRSNLRRALTVDQRRCAALVNPSQALLAWRTLTALRRNESPLPTACTTPLPRGAS